MPMNKEDIINLAKLARLELTENEVDKYSQEIGSILGYIEQINSAIGESEGDFNLIENSGDRNVFREDTNADEPETYKDSLLKCAPKTKDDFIQVQKILNNDNGSN